MGIGERLKKARENAGLTMSDVEEKTGIHFSYISHLENGRRKNPSFETIQKLAEVYGVEESYILGEENNKNFESLGKSDKEFLLNLLNDKERLLLLRQTKNMTSNDLKKVIRIIKAIHEEEKDKE